MEKDTILIENQTVLNGENDEFYYSIRKTENGLISIDVTYFLSGDKDKETLSYGNKLNEDELNELLSGIGDEFDKFVEYNELYEEGKNKKRAFYLEKLKDTIQDFIRNIKIHNGEIGEFEDGLDLDDGFNDNSFKNIIEEVSKQIECHEIDLDSSNGLEKAREIIKKVRGNIFEFKPIRIYNHKQEILFIQSYYEDSEENEKNISKSSLKNDLVNSLKAVKEYSEFQKSKGNLYGEDYTNLIFLDKESGDIFVSNKIKSGLESNNILNVSVNENGDISGEIMKWNYTKGDGNNFDKRNLSR